MILISNDFCHNIKMYNFDPYNVFLSIVIHIAVLIKTDSVLQCHIIHMPREISDILRPYCHNS